MQIHRCHPVTRGDSHRYSLPALAFTLALVWLTGTTIDVYAAGTPESVFHIDRSKNDNQVHYRIALDDDCAPRGSEPVEPYWLRRSPGSQRIEPIKWYQQRAYGVAEQKVSGMTVTLTLRALPDREIVIRTGPRAAEEPGSTGGEGDGENADDGKTGTAGDSQNRSHDREPAGSKPAARSACRADAYMKIAGHEARLSRAYVASEEGLVLPKVLYIDLFGETAGGEPVEERIVPD
jgi:hypothetical protein